MADDSGEVSEDPSVRTIALERGPTGFGFNIKGTTQFGGTMQAINGRLYPPLQYVSVVDPASAAYEAGLRANDRILEVNGHDARGAAHSLVVEWVVAGGTKLRIRVLGVSDVEAARLKRMEEMAEEELDGSPKKAKPPVGEVMVVIAGFLQLRDDKGQPYTVFHVYVDNTFRCSRRYREFSDLHKRLKTRFPWFQFPPLPGKKINGLRHSALSDGDVKDRLNKLNMYLSTVFAAEDLYKSDAAQEFLRATDRPTDVPDKLARHVGAKVVVARPLQPAHRVNTHAGAAEPMSQEPLVHGRIDLANSPLAPAAGLETATPTLSSASSTASFRAPKAGPKGAPKTEAANVPVVVGLADGRTVTLNVPGTTTIATLEKLATKEAGLHRGSKLFGIFTETDSLLTKVPGGTFVSAVKAPLLLRRWLFAKAQEAGVEDDLADELLVTQAYQDMVAGLLGELDEETLERFLNLKQQKQWKKFLKAARKLEMYAAVRIPPCAADFPEPNTKVAVVLTIDALVLHQCQPAGDEDTITEPTPFEWAAIQSFTLKPGHFTIVYTADDDASESIVFDTPYAVHMHACVAKIKEEREWDAQLAEGADAKDIANWFAVPAS